MSKIFKYKLCSLIIYLRVIVRLLNMLNCFAQKGYPSRKFKFSNLRTSVGSKESKDLKGRFSLEVSLNKPIYAQIIFEKASLV